MWHIINLVLLLWRKRTNILLFSAKKCTAIEGANSSLYRAPGTSAYSITNELPHKNSSYTQSMDQQLGASVAINSHKLRVQPVARSD